MPVGVDVKSNSHDLQLRSLPKRLGQRSAWKSMRLAPSRFLLDLHPGRVAVYIMALSSTERIEDLTHHALPNKNTITSLVSLSRSIGPDVTGLPGSDETEEI